MDEWKELLNGMSLMWFEVFTVLLVEDCSPWYIYIYIYMYAKVAMETIRGWTSRKLEEYWQSICGQRQARRSLKRPSDKRARELLNLSRNQLRIMTNCQQDTVIYKNICLNWGW
jgi:hypothetical protein